MAIVLVTGGTGTLGRHLVPLLDAAGHDVRVLSRSAGPGRVPGDLRTGEGLTDGLHGVETVVHAATDPFRARRVDVAGTERLLGAAAGGAHVVYVSVVGVDGLPVPYDRAKWQAEQLVEASGVPFTIQRITQFHELLDRGFGMLPVLATPRGFRFQPIAAAEAAERIAELVAAGPQGRAPDVGGPEVRGMDDLARAWKQARGSRKPVLPVPAAGRVAGAIRRGVQLTPDHADGRTTWEAWLSR